MKRTMLLAAVALALGWTVPAWANHSQSTGINCPSFTFQEDAQAYFDLHTGDPEGLDGPPGPTSTGVPGLACEDLPRRGSTTTVVTIPSTTTTTATAAVVARPSSGNSGAASNATAEPGTQILPAAAQTATTVTPIPTSGTTATTIPAAAPATASAARPLALTG